MRLVAKRGQAELEHREEPPAAPLAVQKPGQRERLRETALRLHPEVDWERMSEAAIRRALGLSPPGCPQRREYEAGRRARGEGREPPATASMAFHLGWSHGSPPRQKRRRWRARPVLRPVPGPVQADGRGAQE